jgi:glycerol uptake facilitator protein
MIILLAEFIGTMILTTFGCGVVANVLLSQSKGQNSGWIVICLGWGIAVMVAIYAVGKYSGAHLNPAVTIALVVMGKTDLNTIWQYLTGQFLGAFTGGILVYLNYLPHWEKTEDKSLKLAVFATAPAIKNPLANFLSESIASFFLMLSLLFIGENKFAEGLNPLIICFVIVGIGFSFGGTTGWAVNPARDFGPRMAHYFLPIANKGKSNWDYAWIPLLAPIIGALAAAFFF